MTASADSKTWLITGCSTGLGRALAEEVLRRGDRAAVTARHADQVADIVAAHPETGLALPLDVTDAGQRAAAVQQTEASLGAVDVLVNNAGYGYFAAAEEGEDEAIRAMFETNVFGLFDLTRAVLPGMRERGTGHVINVSSVGGLLGSPGVGYYNATKFAVEGFSEALAQEVGPLGLHVTLIEPGPFRTDWSGRSGRHAAKRIDAYAETSAARVDWIVSNSGRQPGDPVRAAGAICDIVGIELPPLHLVLGQSGLDRVRDKLRTIGAEIDAWESVTLATDYPEGEG